VSSNFPLEPTGTGLPSDVWPGWQPAPKFQHRYWKHIVLFVATLLTTTWAGAEFYYGFMHSVGAAPPTETLTRASGFLADILLPGLWYALPVLLILGAHEFGHYILCRVHNVDATLPYFIPAPFFFIAGTFGAVIKIREAFPSKRALFDIGIAGPIGGFLALVPILFWGVSLSQLTPVTHSESMIYFGEPLLFKAASWVHFGSIPKGYDISLHPLGFAAWWGMLATALNLLPFGQLDGGHIVYAVVKRRNHAAIGSVVTLVAAGLLTIWSLSWISMLIMMVAMALVFGLHHPRVIDEESPLGSGRRLLAVFALIMFVLCFTPVPIQVFLGD
jgi:membrane-associated protease RseP (regulator of RpoE activity)